MEGHMNLIKYIDNLLQFAKDQIEFYKSNLNIQQKKHLNSQININDENDDDNSDEFLEELENEITNEANNIKDNDFNNLNIDNNEINLSLNISLEYSNAFSNKNKSCSFDSFTILFINSILPLLEYNELLNTEYIYDNKYIDKSDEKIIAELKLGYSEKINEMISQDEIQSDVSKKILKRVNKVNDAAIKYKEDFFVKPTPKELAEYLGVTETYILDTVQMSGYEITEIDFEPEKGGKNGS